MGSLPGANEAEACRCVRATVTVSNHRRNAPYPAWYKRWTSYIRGRGNDPLIAFRKGKTASSPQSRHRKERILTHGCGFSGAVVCEWKTGLTMGDTPRTALVTGGAKRVGRAIVEDLAVHGFAVAIHCGRSRAEADALAEDLGKSGASVAVVQADLTDAGAVDGLIGEASAAVGDIGLLVNNASIFEDDLP